VASWKGAYQGIYNQIRSSMLSPWSFLLLSLCIVRLKVVKISSQPLTLSRSSAPPPSFSVRTGLHHTNICQHLARRIFTYKFPPTRNDYRLSPNSGNSSNHGTDLSDFKVSLLRLSRFAIPPTHSQKSAPPTRHHLSQLTFACPQTPPHTEQQPPTYIPRPFS